MAALLTLSEPSSAFLEWKWETPSLPQSGSHGDAQIKPQTLSDSGELRSPEDTLSPSPLPPELALTPVYYDQSLRWSGNPPEICDRVVIPLANLVWIFPLLSSQTISSSGGRQDFMAIGLSYPSRWLVLIYAEINVQNLICLIAPETWGVRPKKS